MSILSKSYELTIWNDVNGVEQLDITSGYGGVIGSSTWCEENRQCRALEPVFSTNVNGVKKLSFKMYKKYIDTENGTEKENPFISKLVSEKKVKLHLPDEPSDNQWHDFIIKNISENSSDGSYTYQLEDALVQELSKNGFGVTLDAKLNNNIGTAEELAKYILQETNWGVSEQSEVFVQTVDEVLVYITIPVGTVAVKLKDQEDMDKGVIPDGTKTFNDNDKTNGTIKALAFYSSCVDKPNRFQFIYPITGLTKDKEGYINTKNCQYYIEYDDPSNDYTFEINSYGFILPKGFNITTVENETICTNYRGKRFGFTPQSKYIPVLDRYVNLYKKDNSNVVYYGYENSEYKSPALTQNLISNSTFESSSGWVGTKKENNGDKAKIESVQGYFDNNGNFINALDELKNGTFDPKIKTYKAYLKLNFQDANSSVINSCLFDNRTLIGQINTGDEWALDCDYKPTISGSTLSFSLGEYGYYSDGDKYDIVKTGSSDLKANFDEGVDKQGYKVFKVTSSNYSEQTFKKEMQIRLQITASTPGIYYLEKIELFKVAYNGTNIIPLEQQGETLEDRVIEKSYYYFTDNALTGITSPDQLVPEAVLKTLTYKTYKPVYNEQAEKIRSVTAKESNYFNILQSIAETFEAWLVLKIGRNTNGGITSREVLFKNYIAGKNNACFRYGVNLKDIQRTFESKNIVTKLIVKNNSNEYAKDGFCTIQRAGANPTGENYIYDFRYFFDKQLMDTNNYLSTLYAVPNGYSINLDLFKTGGGANSLQGYFSKIKWLNNQITNENKLLQSVAEDLTQYRADLEIAKAGLDAAVSGVEQTREDFLLLTGAPIDMLLNGEVTNINVGTHVSDSDEVKKGGFYYSDRSWLAEEQPVTVTSSASDLKITVKVKAKEPSTSSREIYVKVYPKITLTKNGSSQEVIQCYTIKCTIPASELADDGTFATQIVESETNQDIVVGDFSNNTGAQKLIKEYAEYCINEQKYSSDKTSKQALVNSCETEYHSKQADIKQLTDWKKSLNEKFFEKYSRYIQEGTWISEEYIDDELYYADAQSVMYNSCYPQVAYAINVMSLEGLPGYEDFKYRLGETTNVVDIEFFGGEGKEEVIIVEKIENLDDSSKNQIRVQNFKNQFQDLFQKITATVQQAQYNTGSYEKAVALAEANQVRKQQFLADALDSANSKFFVGKQPSVRLTNEGLLVENPDSPCDAIKMVGGAILLSKQDENGQQAWVTGVTSDGISASLITAGVLNAGEIAIMNYDEPVFRWDSFGISAYYANWYDDNFGTVVSGVNTSKFVRFDKHGLYGINGGADGANWHPTGAYYDGDPFKEIDDLSTFSLTWEGLKVTGDKATLRIGNGAKVNKNDDTLLSIKDSYNNITFAIKNDGSIIWGTSDSGSSPVQVLYSTTKSTISDKPIDGTDWTKQPNNAPSSDPSAWHRVYQSGDWYASYTYNGGANWTNPIRIAGASTSKITEWYYATENSSEEVKGPNDDGYLSGGWNSKWKDTPVSAGHGPVKKYLWNYEETELSNGTKVYSQPALITTQPKSVQKIYEFYLVNNGVIPTKPTFGENPWNGSNLSYTNTVPPWTMVDTSENINSSIKISQSKYLWNFEVVCYDDKTCSIGAVANIGAGGEDIIKCEIESNLGFLLSDETADATKITLIAKIFEGNTQIDQEGKFTYKWYYLNNNIETELKNEKGIALTGKTIQVNFSAIKNKEVYFKATQVVE